MRKSLLILLTVSFSLILKTTNSQVITPVWTDSESGTLNGVPFTITGFESSHIITPWDFNGSDFSCAPLDSNEQALDYAGASDLTITFGSPISGLKIYMRWWRTDRHSIDHPYTILCGSGVAVGSNDSLIVSGWGNGILAVQDTVNTITISSIQGCCSHQVVLFGAGEPVFAGIEDENNTTSITIFPNPVSETLYFSESGDIIITDISGKIIVQALDKQLVDVSSFNSGIYIVQFKNENGQLQHQRIVKE